MTYATTPRINEGYVEKVADYDDQFVRVWRCRCTECGHSTMFNEQCDGKQVAV